MSVVIKKNASLRLFPASHHDVCAMTKTMSNWIKQMWYTSYTLYWKWLRYLKLTSIDSGICSLGSWPMCVCVCVHIYVHKCVGTRSQSHSLSCFPLLLSTVSFLIIWNYYNCVWIVCVRRYTFHSGHVDTRRRTMQSWSSSSPFIWVPGFKLRSLGFCNKYTNLVVHLTGLLTLLFWGRVSH